MKNKLKSNDVYPITAIGAEKHHFRIAIEDRDKFLIEFQTCVDSQGGIYTYRQGEFIKHSDIGFNIDFTKQYPILSL